MKPYLLNTRITVQAIRKGCMALKVTCLLMFCFLTETKPSETKTLSTSLGKRRPSASANDVSCKYSSPQIVSQAVTTSSYTSPPQAVELPMFSEMQYATSISPLYTGSQSSAEPSRTALPESAQLDQGSITAALPQMVPTLATPVPPVSHMFHLIGQQSAAAGFSSQHAIEASVHPLLSMVQQVIPPLHDYSPPVPSSQAAYPYHASSQLSHQAVQSLRHAVDQPAVHNAEHQTSVPLLLARTASSSASRGASSHVKSKKPKVIIVSGTGMSSATTICGPPLSNATTSTVTAPTPTPPGNFLHISFGHVFGHVCKQDNSNLIDSFK